MICENFALADNKVIHFCHKSFYFRSFDPYCPFCTHIIIIIIIIIIINVRKTHVVMESMRERSMEKNTK